MQFPQTTKAQIQRVNKENSNEKCQGSQKDWSGPICLAIQKNVNLRCPGKMQGAVHFVGKKQQHLKHSKIV